MKTSLVTQPIHSYNLRSRSKKEKELEVGLFDKYDQSQPPSSKGLSHNTPEPREAHLHTHHSTRGKSTAPSSSLKTNGPTSLAESLRFDFRGILRMQQEEVQARTNLPSHFFEDILAGVYADDFKLCPHFKTGPWEKEKLFLRMPKEVFHDLFGCTLISIGEKLVQLETRHLHALLLVSRHESGFGLKNIGLKINFFPSTEWLNHIAGELLRCSPTVRDDWSNLVIKASDERFTQKPSVPWPTTLQFLSRE